MTFRILAAASALSLGLSFGLSVAAQAQPTPNPPAAATAVAPAASGAATVKPAGYRTAKYSGGAGATWKTGRDAYGFGGSYGGCRYSGHAGSGGYKIDRTC